MTDTNGYVPTPPCVADYMANWLFTFSDTTLSDARILYPGLGTGNLYSAVDRYCTTHNITHPDAVGIEITPERIAEFNTQHPHATLDIHCTDFLANPPSGTFDYILANPPYIPYRGIPDHKRDPYRDTFELATGQFKVQHLFFEQALDLLADDGWLVFLTPHKFLQFNSDEPLRNRIREENPQAFISMPRPIFPNHTVDTVVSVIQGSPSTTLSDGLWIETIHRDSFTKIATALEFPDDVWSRYQKGLKSKQNSVFTRARKEAENTTTQRSQSSHSNCSQATLGTFTD